MKNTKHIIRTLVFAALLAALLYGAGAMGLGSTVGEMLSDFSVDIAAVVRLAIMIALVLAIENIILFILGLIRSEKRRLLTAVSLTASAVKYISIIIIICWGLAILGADIGTIVAGIGVITLIIGFGAESLVSDVVTGVFMMFENQYNVGDYVEVGGFRGKVTNIGIRTTSLEDAGGNVKIINNSSMSNILNRSSNNSRAVCTIGIPYETDLEALEAKIPAMLKQIAENHSDVFVSEPAYLGVDELADSAVVLKFVAEVDDKNIYSGARILNHDIFLAFRKAGIEVPFPQLDVHSK